MSAEHGGDPAECRTCSAPVVWAKHESTGKRMPLNRDPIPGGPYQIDERGIARVDRSYPEGRISHFATCPQAKSWRKP